MEAQKKPGLEVYMNELIRVQLPDLMMIDCTGMVASEVIVLYQKHKALQKALDKLERISGEILNR